MAVQVPLLHSNLPSHFPTCSRHVNRAIQQSSRTAKMTLKCNMITRRAVLVASLVAVASEVISGEKLANAIDFRITTPDQTVEQAESGIRGHAESLVRVKELLEEGSWKAAQKALRKSSAELKQDIYTIIQGKSGGERAELRKLYSKLFNYVTKLDYAALDKDFVLVRACYDHVVVALVEIMSRLGFQAPIS